MKQRNSVWVSVGAIVILFFFAVSIFLLLVYFGEQTKDPDAYEFFGWFAMLGIMFTAFIVGCITFGLWLAQRDKTVKLFKN